MVDSPGPLDGLGRHRGGAKFTPLGGGAESPKQACMTFPDHSRRASKLLARHTSRPRIRICGELRNPGKVFDDQTLLRMVIYFHKVGEEGNLDCRTGRLPPDINKRLNHV